MAPRKQAAFADLFGEELYGTVVEFARLNTLTIINEAAARGPVWSGDFRDSWRAVANVPAAGGTADPAYPYELRDIPRPKFDEATFQRRAKLFNIVNESGHRLYALDAKRGLFYPPAGQPDPIGDRVLHGRRITSDDGTSMRADVVDKADYGPDDKDVYSGSATAEEDWFEKLTKDLPQILKDRKTEHIRKAKRTAKEKLRRARK